MAADVRAPMQWPYRMHESKILHGAGSLDKIPDELDYLDASRALLLCGPHAARTPSVARVRELLGDRIVAEYTSVEPHSQLGVVREVAALTEETGVDIIVCVGGGSTSDTAKCVTSQLGEGKPIEQLASSFTPPDHYVEQYLKKPKIPIVAVPTTLSGAEVAPGFGVTNKERIKLLYRGDYVAARIIVLDPVATLDTDLGVFLASGMNGLAHGIEGLYSRSRQPLSDAQCVESIRLFVEFLPQTARDPEDLHARLQLLYASVMGGRICTNARVGIHHGVCHCIGARLGLSHGVANGIMLPYSMAFNLPETAYAQARAADAMGVSNGHDGDEVGASHAAIERVVRLKEELSIPARLSDATKQVTDEDLQMIAQDCQKDRALYFNPRPISGTGEIIKLLESAR